MQGIGRTDGAVCVHLLPDGAVQPAPMGALILDAYRLAEMRSMMSADLEDSGDLGFV